MRNSCDIQLVAVFRHGRICQRAAPGRVLSCPVTRNRLQSGSRDGPNRVFAWEDKLRRLLLRSERLGPVHVEIVAYTIIDLRLTRDQPMIASIPRRHLAPGSAMFIYFVILINRPRIIELRTIGSVTLPLTLRLYRLVVRPLAFEHPNPQPVESLGCEVTNLMRIYVY
jgi:hypothetical protein